MQTTEAPIIWDAVGVIMTPLWWIWEFPWYLTDSQKNVDLNMSNLAVSTAPTGRYGAASDCDIYRYIYNQIDIRKWGDT